MGSPVEIRRPHTRAVEGLKLNSDAIEVHALRNASGASSGGFITVRQFRTMETSSRQPKSSEWPTPTLRWAD
jgi:hypothetical protein